jgi:hypothetical protein
VLPANIVARLYYLLSIITASQRRLYMVVSINKTKTVTFKAKEVVKLQTAIA